MKMKLCALGVAAGLMSSVALADSPYSQMYVFGDSLSDTGAFGGKATNREGPDYINGPFALISVERFATAVGVDMPMTVLMNGTNFAVGGFRSDQILASIASPVGQTHPVLGNLPSYVSSVGAADPNAIYYISGGGNDFLQQPDYDMDGSFGPGDIQIAAGQVFAGADILGDMGANYIVVPNLVALHLAPAIQFQQYSLPPAAFAQLVGQTKAGVDGFNLFLESLVSGSEHNIIMPDVNTAMVEFFSNPQAYGYALNSDQIGVTCFDTAALCPPVTGFEKTDATGAVNPNANPDFFAFNDPVHPTGKAHTLFSIGLESIFTAPDLYGSMPALALADMNDQAATLRSQMNRLRFSGEGASMMLSVTDNESDWQSDFLMNGQRKTEQVQLGYQAPVGDTMRFGFAATVNKSQIHFGPSMGSNVYTGIDNSTVDSDSFGLVASANWKTGGLYAEISPEFMFGSMSTLRDIRILGLNRIQTADTDFTSVGLSMTAGYNLFSDSNFSFGPMIDAAYRKVSINAFDENQMNANALFVGEQSWSEESGALGAFLGYSSQSWYFDARARYVELGNSGRETITMGLQTIRSNSFWLPTTERTDNMIEAEAMIGVDVGGLDIGARYRMQDFDGLPKQQSISITASMNF